MLPRSPEAEALTALLKRNQDGRTPRIVERTPTGAGKGRKVPSDRKGAARTPTETAPVAQP